MRSRPPSEATANTVTSSLEAFVTSRYRPSDDRTTEPWDVRCGFPSPAPPVSKASSSDNAPSSARRNAITLLLLSLVCTYTAPSMVPFDICPPVALLVKALPNRLRRRWRRYGEALRVRHLQQTDLDQVCGKV